MKRKNNKYSVACTRSVGTGYQQRGTSGRSRADQGSPSTRDLGITCPGLPSGSHGVLGTVRKLPISLT